MAQFKFANEMNNLVSVEGPLTKVPQARWQKKGIENMLSLSDLSNLTLNSSKAQNNLTLNSSKAQNNLTLNSSKAQKSFSTSVSRTPSKYGNDMVKPRRTPKPARFRTRSATPSRLRTPISDRFIPCRSSSNFDLAHYKITHQDENLVPDSPSKREFQRLVSESLGAGDVHSNRILSYKHKAAVAPDGFVNPMRVLYSQTKTPSSAAKSGARYIPQNPDRILDAPNIIDDYYLNLMDWGPSNVLAAALGSSVYLWNAASGKIDELLELEGNEYVCSLAWIQEGDFLAVGTSDGTIELWDCSCNRRTRIMRGHSARVASMSWNSYVLSSGARSGQIIHSDVRQREHAISRFPAHAQEVCGLKWSPDGRYMATGGNDNILNIWQGISGTHHSQSRPLHVFNHHQAAVKALAWCPWQPNILASGGGTADRHIRFWNANNGNCLNAVDTKSQVCALIWSTNYKELISGQGFANNELIIWKYPAMTKVAELTGHTSRILNLAMSPDGTTVLSAAADETLRLWKCFVKNPSKVKTAINFKEKSSILKSIR